MPKRFNDPVDIVSDPEVVNFRRILAAKLIPGFAVKQKKNGDTVLRHPTLGRYYLKPTPMQRAA